MHGNTKIKCKLNVRVCPDQNDVLSAHDSPVLSVRNRTTKSRRPRDAHRISRSFISRMIKILHSRNTKIYTIPVFVDMLGKCLRWATTGNKMPMTAEDCYRSPVIVNDPHLKFPHSVKPAGNEATKRRRKDPINIVI